MLFTPTVTPITPFFLRLGTAATVIPEIGTPVGYSQTTSTNSNNTVTNMGVRKTLCRELQTQRLAYCSRVEN